MKLVKYDRSNCSSLRTDDAPVISFNPKGIISLNAGAMSLIGLKQGDGITIAQDEEDPECWFIGKDANGFLLRKFGEKSTSYAANSRGLVQKVLKAVETTGEGVLRIKIAQLPTKVGKETWWGILMPSAAWYNRYAK